ncbi:MAG: alpha/beta hydrolase [Chloroflexi bacterium]|nr:alpha/beta hydrolase [Chloroflexota bacterium]
MFQDKQATCNGLRLHYLDWGNDGAPPLLLLHGIHGTAHAWDALADALRSQFRILALDLRGHADSEWATDGNYEGQALLADLSAFISQLQLNQVAIIGESLGGVVAFAYAAMNPTTIRGLAVVDIGPEINAEGLQDIRESSQNRPADFADFGEALSWSSGDRPVPAAEAIERRLRHNLKETDNGRLTWKYDPRVDTITSSGGPEGDNLLWQLWSSLKCPTLVIRGERSKLLTPESTDKMLAACPTAILRTIPDVGHAVLVDNQPALIGETRAFLVEL